MVGASVDSNEFSVARATEKLRVNERSQSRLALSGVEPPHPLDLSGGQAEPRAFEIFGPYVMDDRVGYGGGHSHSNRESGRKAGVVPPLRVRRESDQQCKACAPD